MYQIAVRNELGELVPFGSRFVTQGEAYRAGKRKYGEGNFSVTEVSSWLVSNYKPPTAKRQW